MIALTLFAVLATQNQTELVLTGLDPVELIAGRQVPGREEFSTDYLRHHYRFSSAANREAFLTNTIKYAVQNGGACGKMGAMTGKGSPDRFAVVQGRIYLFASDGCRDGVVGNPAPYFAERSTVGQISNQTAYLANERLQQAIAVHGGDAVKNLRNVQWGRATQYEEGGVQKVWWTRDAITGTDKFAHWAQSPTLIYYFVRQGSHAVDGDRKGRFGVHPGELRELTATFARHPAGILMGLGRPVNMTQDGEGIIMVRDDIVYEVRFDRNGRIGKVSYRDFAAGPVTDVEREFSNNVRVSGVWLPKSWRTRFNGGNWGAVQTLDELVVNGQYPSIFQEAFSRTNARSGGA